MRNQIKTTLKLTRGEICDLMLSCSFIYKETNSSRWYDLHEKLRVQLQEFDDDIDKFYDEITR